MFCFIVVIVRENLFFPDIKALDSGLIYGMDILGSVKQVTISTCPFCNSEKICKEKSGE